MSIVDEGKKYIKECVQKGFTEEVNNFVEKFAKYLNNKNNGENVGEKEKLTTSQIRNIFGAIKKLEQKGFDETEFRLLKPHIAYAAARGKKGTKDLGEVLQEGINVVLNSTDKNKAFKNFFNFFEALLCYHKSVGGD
jgi:CRISPR-associated protein Csm2